MRLVLVGPPGSGKGTQAELLVKRLGLTYVGPGDILRDAIRRQTAMGRQVEPIIKQGLPVPDHVVNGDVALLDHYERQGLVKDVSALDQAEAVYKNILKALGK